MNAPTLAAKKKSSGSSRYRGVFWNYDRKCWQAQISNGQTPEGKQVMVYIGRFENEEDAARAYDAKAVELRGDSARVNFPSKRGAR